MFQSYTYKLLDYDAKLKQSRYEHTIVDDDFVAVAVAVAVAVGAATGIASTVIEEYSRRNLPVAPNLFRCLRFISIQFGYSIQEVIAWSKQYNKHFPQYEEEINKLMVLL